MAYAELMLADEYGCAGVRQWWADEFACASETWNRERQVITRLECGAQGSNPRFFVTNLEGEAVDLNVRRYCAVGEAQNWIKEARLDLFGTRASSHRFAAN